MERLRIQDRLPKLSADEQRILAAVACSMLYFLFTKSEVAGLILAGVAVTIAIYQAWKAFPFLGKPNIMGACGAVLTTLWVVRSQLPAHALLDGVEIAIINLLAETDTDPAAIMNFFIILDLLIIFVLIGSVAFAIYQGSQSNDIRPILFVIAFIVGGIMVIEIGASLIIGAAAPAP